MSFDPSPPGGESTAPASVEALLGRFPVLRPPVPTAGAAVTIVLRNGNRGPETLLIERATNPDDPASGHVSLPGGRVEDQDGTLAATALRELHEEVGLSATDFAGPLHFVATVDAPRFGLRVGVFAGELGPGHGVRVADVREVAHVFWLPSEELGRTQTATPASLREPATVPATFYEGHLVWGFTRRVLRSFFGFPQEDEPVGVIVPSHAPPPETRFGPGAGDDDASAEG